MSAVAWAFSIAARSSGALARLTASMWTRLAPLGFLSSFLLASWGPAAASAQTPRAARAVGLFVERPALLVARDRAFVPELPDGAVSVCAHATGACRSIRAHEACEPGRCPGSGVLLVLESSVADVGDYPTDRDGLQREWDAVASDPHVSSLAAHLVRPPPPPPPGPPPSLHLRSGDWRLEGSLGGGAVLRPDAGVALGSMSATFGFRFGYDWDREEVLQILFGSSLGADLRVRVLPSILGGPFEQLSVAVGVGPSMTFAPRRELFRIGAGYFSIIPELGVITRPDVAPAFYAGWSIPFAVALDGQVAVELRAWAWIVDDWIEGDEVGWLAGLDAALVVF